MNLRQKYPDLLTHLAIATAISLVVNFSYLLLLIVEQNYDPGTVATAYHKQKHIKEKMREGILRISPDGHGYMVCDNDSVYVPMHRIYRLGLGEGDSLKAKVRNSQRDGGHPMMMYLTERNGKFFDYSSIYRHPSSTSDIVLQLVFYMLLSFLIISLLTVGGRQAARKFFVYRCLTGVAVAIVLYTVAPVPNFRTGTLTPNFMNRSMFDYMLVLKCSFAVVVSLLYGRVYLLIMQRQAMMTENEQLKNENLTTRYNMLVGQVNPHFFFNSLNSLSMLVREKEEEKALKYIEQLSYTFRYTLQSGQNTLVTLGEELKFTEAFGYLFKIRYADKLFITIDVPAAYNKWQLPVMSLQPLIENAVKHNTITKAHPLVITLTVSGDKLVISNPKRPKIDKEPSTGIGLENLNNRMRLLTGREIEIRDTESDFIVTIPLKSPQQC